MPGGFNRQKDLEIASHVRVEMVKRWVEMAKVEISVIKAAVDIRGQLEFSGTPRLSDQDAAQRLKILDMVLRSVNGVRSIHWSLNNWVKEGERWVKKRRGPAGTPAKSRGSGGGKETVFNVDAGAAGDEDMLLPGEGGDEDAGGDPNA
jgi:hypothetical protein